jgi:hypothetical protein
MADSLVLTGVKDIKKHAGDEMLLTHPERGGDTHLVKEWWKSGVSTLYTSCTIFDVTTGAGTVKLVLDTNYSTNVYIHHDGSFNFTFGRPNELRRGALYTENMELIEHYVFPAISGGKMMTVTPPGSASRPIASTTIGTVTVSGTNNPSVGGNYSYTAAISGDASNLTYAWSVSGNGIIQGASNTAGISVEFTAGDSTITCQVSDADASDSPASGNLTVTAA